MNSNGNKNKPLIYIYIYNLIPFIIFFFLMFYFSKMSTIMADDVRYSMRSSFNFILPFERITNIKQAIQSSYYDYISINGRYMTSFLIMLVMMGAPLSFRILNPIILTLTFYILLRLVKGKRFDSVKDLVINSVALLSIFMFNIALLDEDLFWMTGTITYAWPLLAVSILLIPFINYLRDIPDKKANIIISIIYIILSIYVGSTVENLSVSLSVLCLVGLLFHLYKKDKGYFKGYRRIISITIWIANIIQLMSPGMHNRADTISYGLISRILIGFLHFIEYTFSSSSLLPYLYIYLLIIFVYKLNKKLSIALSIWSLPVFVLNLLGGIPNSFLVEKNIFLYAMYNPRSFHMLTGFSYKYEYLIILFYYSVLLLLILLSILIICINKNRKDYFVFFSFSAITNMILISSGGADFRAAFVSNFFMIICSAMLLYELEIKKIMYPFFIVYLVYLLLALNNRFSVFHANVQVAKVRDEIYANIDKYDGDVIMPKYRFSIHGNFAGEYAGIYTREYYEFVRMFNVKGEIIIVDRQEFGID